MLKLVAALSSRYQPRHYVVADTDAMSADKLHTMEKNRAQCKEDYMVCYIGVIYVLSVTCTCL